MVNDVLLYVGSSIIILWGIAHLIPTRAIADGFGEISGDNRRVLIMEVIAEGITLIFIGVLVILVTCLAGSGSCTADIVYITCAVMLIIMGLVTQVTGARTPVIWYKICPYVKTLVAILFLIGVWI